MHLKNKRDIDKRIESHMCDREYTCHYGDMEVERITWDESERDF